MNARIFYTLASLFLLPVVLSAQSRDLVTQRLAIDDNGADGTLNRMTLQTPATLLQNVLLTIPDPGTSTAQILLAPAGSRGAWLLGGNAGTTPGTDFIGTTDAAHLVFRTSGTERLRIESDGDVGIGTPAPAARLNIVQTGSQPLLAGSGGSVLFSGTTGTTPAAGGGTRFMWIPSKSALRAGYVSGDAWDEANIGQHSVGLGFEAKASGPFSISLAGTAVAQEAIAIGYATSSGTSAIAIGGNNTTASGFIAISIGSANTASGDYSTALGSNNVAAGTMATIAGGNGMTLDATAARSFGFLGGNSGSNNMTISSPNVAVFGNTDLWLANNDNGASQLRFYEANSTTGTFPGSTNYSAFRAAAQSGDILYVLPATSPSVGDVLSATGVAAGTPTVVTLSWVSGIGPSIGGRTNRPALPSEFADDRDAQISTLMNLVNAQRQELDALRSEYSAKLDQLEEELARFSSEQEGSLLDSRESAR